jgi:ABC-2 type transport system ATP-binding protein
MSGVSRYFDKPRFMRALTDVSLEVRRGEVLGLIGPSGSGKSTTLRILAGRLSTSEGKARVFGRPPRRRAARTRVGYLPQKPSHNSAQLLAQVVDFLRDLFSRRKRQPRSPAEDTNAGNERRMVLKQVVLKNPHLLLLDEPFAALDAAGCVEIKDLILTLARRGKTVILTSDSLAQAIDVCDRFAVYYAGKIESIGTLDEILATTDAIRVTGPVLPPESAQRVMEALRESLGRPGPAAELPAPRADGDSPAAAPAAVTEQATVAAPADEKLLPLAGRPGEAASNAVQEQTGPHVNHDRLAALTKPAPTAAPPNAADIP